MTSTHVPGNAAERARSIDRAGASLGLSRRRERVALLVVWGLIAGWVWARLDQGWVAHDDGGFAQSAARVLDGQLPHRDFAELYTGGMTFVNAATMSVFGEDVVVLRYPLFVLFLGFVPAVYFVARSVTGPWTALLTAALAATWSVPVYPAPMVSWYELMFSVFAAACLIRWRAKRLDRWLLAAGVLAGLAVAFKIVGVYLVVAVLLFLVFVDGARPRTSRRAWADLASLGALALAGGLLLSVLGGQLGAPEIVNLALPVAAVAIAVWVERARGRSVAGDGTPQSPLLRNVGLFLGGAAVPIALLLIPYIALGAIGDFVDGVFVAPQSRRDLAYFATPPAAHLAVAVLLVVAVISRARLSSPARRALDVWLMVVAVVGVGAAAVESGAHGLVWIAARGLGPVIVFTGVALLVLRWKRIERDRREIVFLLLALVALVGLVQFPFGISLYYCYVAPLVALAAVALASDGNRRDQPVVCVLVGAFALFGAAYLDRSSYHTIAEGFVRDGQVAVLDPDRASIHVYPGEASALTRIVSLLRRHSSGSYTFAGPDMPHVYFLSNLDNPTRSLFDFVDPTDSARGAALLRTLQERRVTAIAIDRFPAHSDPLDRATLLRLAAMYPNLVRIGEVDVRWRDQAQA